MLFVGPFCRAKNIYDVVLVLFIMSSIDWHLLDDTYRLILFM